MVGIISTHASTSSFSLSIVVHAVALALGARGWLSWQRNNWLPKLWVLSWPNHFREVPNLL